MRNRCDGSDTGFCSQEMNKIAACVASPFRKHRGAMLRAVIPVPSVQTISWLSRNRRMGHHSAEYLAGKGPHSFGKDWKKASISSLSS